MPEPEHCRTSAKPPQVEPDLTCSECGVFGAVQFDGVALCPTCYAEKGSCCPEFGKDDLWRQRESARTSP